MDKLQEIGCCGFQSLPGDIPATAGTSFKPQHAEEISDDPGQVEWFEIHPENYMVDGGPRLAQLQALRNEFSLSMHGVGLSLGAGEPPNDDHLKALQTLIERFEPGLVSEHLAWSTHEGIYLADLLPPALTKPVLAGVIDAIDKTQETLGRQILIENPSWYLPRPDSWLTEVQFINEMAQCSGCALLIDVNNVYVSAHNLGFDAGAYIDALTGATIAEIHLAGHSVDFMDGESILIDTHGAHVADPVWDLYARLIRRVGPKPTLIEWDTNLPDWSVLREEARKANEKMSQSRLVTRRAS